MTPNPDDDALRRLLAEARAIAVVGASPNPERPSHAITRLLIDAGYAVFPVHPKAETILGRRAYRRLTEIPEPIDIVDVFRRPEAAPEVAREAARIGAKALWLQQGITSDEACRIANEAGMVCVQDLCIGVMLRVLFPNGRPRADGG